MDKNKKQLLKDLMKKYQEKDDELFPKTIGDPDEEIPMEIAKEERLTEELSDIAEEIDKIISDQIKKFITELAGAEIYITEMESHKNGHSFKAWYGKDDVGQTIEDINVSNFPYESL
jgi:hypothetical protein